MVVRSDTGTTPSRYTVTKRTTIVDESGAPVSVERISAGSPLSIQYTGTSDHLVASHIVVQRPTAVTEQQTTTTRALTRYEKHELKEEREHQKKAENEAIEKQKHKLDDDHHE